MYIRILWVLLSMLSVFPQAAFSKERSGEVTMVVTIAAPEDSRDVRVWIPYPVSDSTQDISNVKISGNYSQSGVYGEKETGNLALYAEWTKPGSSRVVTLIFDAVAGELQKRDMPAQESDIPVEVKDYLKSTAFILKTAVAPIQTACKSDRMRVS